jgi:hypothetical protein
MERIKPMKQIEPMKHISKPLASISLDLDNQWSYMKTHGDAGWGKFPSYLDLFIPNVLDILEQLNLKITFFIVGQDAALARNRDALKLLVVKGHDVGNHSFHHEPWMDSNGKGPIEKEVLKAEEHIINATGQKPIGFRSPGFKWTPELFEILAENGYFYDSSVHPTYIAPLARYFYFRRTKFSEEQKKERKNMIGIGEVTKPNKPFIWQLSSKMKLLELPVTTMPVFRIPFHLSYLIFLSCYSETLMLLYFKISLLLSRMTKIAPVFTIHPTDLLDKKQIPELGYYPGMEISAGNKKKLFKMIIELFRKYYMLISLNDFAQLIPQEDLQEKPINNR